MSDARRIAGELHLAFSQSTNASDLVVMATGDEDSAGFARDAEAKMNQAARSADDLRPLLLSLDFSNESALLAQFEERFAAYQALERSILGLAVENTNLKAQRLSFGPVQDAAEAFRAAAESSSVNESDEKHFAALKAIAAVREIQVLEAPHIAEANDDAMTRLEQIMAEQARIANDALKTLGAPSAEAALNRFIELHAQVIALSRRNSNVRSLAMTLGQQRTLAAQCEDTLRALEEALSKRGFVATR